MSRAFASLRVVGASFALGGMAACGGADGAGPGEDPSSEHRVVASVSVTPQSATLTYLGETIPFTAVAQDTHGAIIHGARIHWASSVPTVVEIDETGVATATGDGVATVTASASGVPSDPVPITVSRTVTTLEVTPSGPLQLQGVGSTITLTATALDAGGSSIAGHPVAWTSSDPSVASVDADGRVTAVRNGVSHVRAEVDQVQSNSVTVTVTGISSVATIEVTPSGPLTFTEVGETRQLTAVARDVSGQPVDTDDLVWGSAVPSVAAVEQDGTVTALSGGTAGVGARVGHVTSNVVLVEVVLPTSTAAPIDLAMAPGGGYLYVANRDRPELWVVSTTSHAVTGTVPLNAAALNVAIQPDGAFAYAGTRVGPTTYEHQIAVIATASHTVTATLTGPEPRSCALSACAPSELLFIPHGTVAYTWTSDFFGVPPNGSFYAWRRHRISTVTPSLVGSTEEYDLAGRPAVTPDGTTLYVPRFNTDSVSVISTATDDIVTHIAVGSTPTWATMSPHGARVYVSNGGSSSLSVISTSSNTVVAEIPVNHPAHGSVITPDGTSLYVANAFQNRLAVVATAMDAVVDVVQLPAQPRSLVVSPDGSRVYVATAVSLFNRTPRGTVEVVATDTNTIVASIPVGLEPAAAALTPDGSLLFVANRDSGSLSVIRTDQNAVVATIAP